MIRNCRLHCWPVCAGTAINTHRNIHKKVCRSHVLVRKTKTLILIDTHPDRNAGHCQILGGLQGFSLALLSHIHHGVDLRRKESAHLAQIQAASGAGPEPAEAVNLSASKGDVDIQVHHMLTVLFQYITYRFQYITQRSVVQREAQRRVCATVLCTALLFAANSMWVCPRCG